MRLVWLVRLGLGFAGLGLGLGVRVRVRRVWIRARVRVRVSRVRFRALWGFFEISDIFQDFRDISFSRICQDFQDWF